MDCFAANTLFSLLSIWQFVRCGGICGVGGGGEGGGGDFGGGGLGGGGGLYKEVQATESLGCLATCHFLYLSAVVVCCTVGDGGGTSCFGGGILIIRRVLVVVVFTVVVGVKVDIVLRGML